MQPNYNRELNWEEINNYSKTHTVRDCASHFGFSLTTWTKAVKSGKVDSKTILIPFEIMAVENSKYPRNSIKRKIIEQNLLEYKCKKCNNVGEWMEEKISLVLDHINGIKNDHRLENLRFLCPNCNSQTPTFSGRNTKIAKSPKIIKLCDCGNKIHKTNSTGKCMKCYHRNKTNRITPIPKEDLINLIKEKPISTIKKELGLRSDNTIRYWCYLYKINHKELSPFSRTNKTKKPKKIKRIFPSKYLYVNFQTTRNKWAVFIKNKDNTIYCSRFNTELEAAQAVANYFNSKELIIRKNYIIDAQHESRAGLLQSQG